jgi:hypothetical protein
MSENRNLPPDLDARIIAEAAFGATHAEIMLTISPRGTPEDHLTILRRIDTLLIDGKLERFTYTDIQGQQRDCVMSTLEAALGGVAA